MSLSAHSPSYKIELEVKRQSNSSNKLVTKLVIDNSKQYTLGRSIEEADIVLKDPNASRQHFTIQLNQGSLHILDLQTKNGTFLNGERISTSRLNIGDIITIGEHIISVANITRVEKKSDVTSIMSCKKINTEVKYGEIIRNVYE